MSLSFLTSLGPGVGNHLWQSTVFCALVWVVALVLRRNSARVRYGLWLVGSVKFLVPFSLLIGLGGLLPRPTRVVVAAPVYSAVDSVGLPFSEITEPVDLPVTHVVSFREQLVAQLPIVIAGVWGCGVVAVLLVWLVRWRRVAAAMRRAVRVESGREFEILRRVDARGEVRLRMSRELMEPGVFGVWRPVLLWPEALSLRLEDEHIAAIVAHELMHVRRRDNLAAMLHMVVEAAFWFHPMVWWMERRMVEERERACDEAVVEAGNTPGVYAESLLKAVRFCVESPLVCVAGISGADLKDRVVRIVTERVIRKLGFGRKALLVGVGLMAVALPIVLGVMNAPLRAQMSGMSDDWVRAAGGKLQFDVASVRANKSGMGPTGEKSVSNVPLGSGNVYGPNGGILMAKNSTLLAYIRFAYKMTDTQEEALRASAPDWVTKDGFNIEARTANRNATKDQMRLMMRSLLVERFKLAMHYETRQVPVYGLVEVKPGTMGPKLQPHPVGATCWNYPATSTGPNGTSAAEPPETVDRGFPSVCGGILDVPSSAQDRYSLGARNVPMSLIASSLSSWGNLRRPVVDRTGLSGNYDFVLEYTPDPRPKWMTVDSGGPTFQEALKQQLGMRLEAQKGSVEFLVLDHVERPMGQDEAGFVEAAPLATPSPSAIAPLPKPSLQPVAFVQGNAAPQPTTSEPAKPMTFAVASIRLSGPDSHSLFMPQGTAENLRAGMVTVESLIGFAYDIPYQQVLSSDPRYSFNPRSPNLLGGPEWVSTDHYELAAKADEATVAAWDKLPPQQKKEQLQKMMQALLADRFHLVMHRETREMPVWALVVAKGGSKLTASPPLPPYDPSTPYESYENPWKLGLGLIGGKGVTMSELAKFLWSKREIESRKVIDRTGLEGTYSFTLKWTPEDGASSDSGLSLFTAIQEQLGLKLESTKAPLDVLVIDHVERPSEN